MCLICIDYKKLSFTDLVKNATELSNVDPDHAEEFFYMLQEKDPELLEKLEKYYWDNLYKQFSIGLKNGQHGV
jgi:hypothetical protein